MTPRKRPSVLLILASFTFCSMLFIAPALAQVKDLYKCEMCGGKLGQNCCCMKADNESQECDDARAWLLDPSHHCIYTPRQVDPKHMSCIVAKTLARAFGWKSNADLRQEATHKLDALERHDALKADAEKRLADQKAAALERKEVNDRHWAELNAKPRPDTARNAPRLKDLPTQHASGPVPDVASAPQVPEPPTPKDFATELVDGAKAKAIDIARDQFEKKTGINTHPPGEAAANRVKEYIETAEDHLGQLDGVASTAHKGVMKLGDEIDGYLRRPGEAAGRVGPSDFARQTVDYAGSGAAQSRGGPAASQDVAADLFGPVPAAAGAAVPARIAAADGSIQAKVDQLPPDVRDLFRLPGATTAAPPQPVPATQPTTVPSGPANSTGQLQDALFGPAAPK